MRARWIFLLLCAILVQLNISDSFVDKHEYELNTMPSNLTGKQFLQGDVSNDTELSSGTGKIRRPRSLDEEMTQAKNDMESQKLAMNAAKQNEQEAKKKEEEGEEQWKKARDNLTDIISTLSNAVNEQSKANEPLEKAREKEDEKKEEVEEAEGEFIVVNLTYKSLKMKEKKKKDDYTAKENDFNAKEADQKNAFARNESAYQNLTEAQGDLTTFKSELKKQNANLKQANSISGKVNQTIRDHDTLKALRAEKLEAENNRRTCQETRNAATTNQTELEAKKELIEGILKGKSLDKWKDMTVDDAIVEQTELVNNLTEKLNGSDTDSVRTDELKEENRTLTDLMELKNNLNLTGKVKDIPNEKKKLVDKVDAEIESEKEKKEKAENDIENYTKNISEIANRLGNWTFDMTSEYNLTTEGFEKLAKSARKNQKAATAKLIEEAQKVVDKELEGKDLSTKITNLNTTYKNEENYLKENNTAMEAAKLAKGYAQGNWSEAKSVADNWNNAKVIPANFAKELAEKALVDAITSRRSAQGTVNDWKQLVEEYTDQKKEATQTEKNKEEEKKKLKEKHDLYVQIVDEVQKKINEAEEKFNVLQRKAGEENARKSKMAAVGWGLGGTLFVIVLVAIGGVLAFIIIRRKKKNVKAKKPSRIEFRLDNGLTCIRREGQPDQHVVKGDDFKIMGPLVMGKVSNTVPTKHLMDDQVGGEKIDGPLSFPPEMNEAYFIGEGVEINIDDSVSIKPETPQDPEAGLLDGLDKEWLEARMKEVEEKYPEYNAQRKKNAPPSSEEKNSDEKKPEEKKKSAKDNRPNDSKPKNVPSDPVEGEKKAAKSPMK